MENNIVLIYQWLTVYFSNAWNEAEELQNVVLNLLKPSTDGQKKLAKQILESNLDDKSTKLKLINQVKLAVKRRVINKEKKAGKNLEYIDYFANNREENKTAKTVESILCQIKDALKSDDWLIFQAYHLKYKSPENIANHMKMETWIVKNAIYRIGKKIESLEIEIDSFDSIMNEVNRILNEEEKELFYKYYQERMKQKDLAKLYGISQPAIHKRIKKLSSKIRKLNKTFNIEALNADYILPSYAEGSRGGWHIHKEDNGEVKWFKQSEIKQYLDDKKTSTVKPKYVEFYRGFDYKGLKKQRFMRKIEAESTVSAYLADKGIVWQGKTVAVNDMALKMRKPNNGADYSGFFDKYRMPGRLSYNDYAAVVNRRIKRRLIAEAKVSAYLLAHKGVVWQGRTPKLYIGSAVK